MEVTSIDAVYQQREPEMHRSFDQASSLNFNSSRFRGNAHTDADDRLPSSSRTSQIPRRGGRQGGRGQSRGMRGRNNIQQPSTDNENFNGMPNGGSNFNQHSNFKKVPSTGSKSYNGPSQVFVGKNNRQYGDDGRRTILENVSAQPNANSQPYTANFFDNDGLVYDYENPGRGSQYYARPYPNAGRRGWYNGAPQRAPRGGGRTRRTHPGPESVSVPTPVHTNSFPSNDVGSKTEPIEENDANVDGDTTHDNLAADDDVEDLPISTDTQERRNDLIRALKNERYSCMICIDKVRRRHYVWSCTNCFHLYHLRCIQGWARVGRDVKGLTRQELELLDRDQNFRCPACQHVHTGVPVDYYCFCGQEKTPEFSPFVTPHSCGKCCSKTVRNGIACSHRCSLQCHPGACPPCTETIAASCPCGKTSQQILCRNKEVFTCSNVCGKRLHCGRHTCKEKCHTGECSPCAAVITKKCFCSKTSRDIPCITLEPAYYAVDGGDGTQDGFACDSFCDRLLACGYHRCRKSCHAGACGDCARLPQVVRTCACGKTPLTTAQREARLKLDCRSPLPVCRQECGKKLLCGHKCALKCHDGDCAVCDKSIAVSCQCKRSTRTIQCRNFATESHWLCAKRCNKKLACDRHRCERSCCPIDAGAGENAAGIHAICDKVCNKKLSCGLHTCDRACGHRGPCPRCLETSYRPLSCHCGQTILEPPIACGTAPPECSLPCTRPHSCAHAPTHSCHSAGHADSSVTCPPCVELVKRECFGGHETRTVACHVKSLSCGRPCGRPLPICGMHLCDRACHDGPCLAAGESCRQPCVMLRSFTCGHPCAAPCHPKYRKCAANAVAECKFTFTIRCACARLERRVACRQLPPCDHGDILFQPPLSSALEGSSSSLGGSVTAEKYESSFTIKCDAECEKQAINRRFAQALNINTMDVSSKLPDHISPLQSKATAGIFVGGKEINDFVKDFYRNNTAYCRESEQYVRACVQKATQMAAVGAMSSNAHWQRRPQDPVSKKYMPTAQLNSPSHTFRTAPKDFRHFLHELAEVYKCESTSYTSDAGGIKKHIVIVARPGTCVMPASSLQETMERHAVASTTTDADRFRHMSSDEQRRLLQTKLFRIVNQYYPAPSIAQKLTSMLMQNNHMLLLELIEGRDENRVAQLRKRTDECFAMLQAHERRVAAGGSKGAADEIVGITSDGAAVFEKKQPSSSSASDGAEWVTVGGRSSSAKTPADKQQVPKKKIDYFDCDD